MTVSLSVMWDRGKSLTAWESSFSFISGGKACCHREIYWLKQVSITERKCRATHVKMLFPSKTIAEDTRKDSLFIGNIPSSKHPSIMMLEFAGSNIVKKDTNIIIRNPWLSLKQYWGVGYQCMSATSLTTFFSRVTASKLFSKMLFQ